jgi:hypothetical protein
LPAIKGQRIMQKKNPLVGLLLTIFFGSFGLLYTSVVGFLAFFTTYILLVILYRILHIWIPIPIYVSYITIMLVHFLELHWTQNVITEHNKRIDDKVRPLSQMETLSVGFSDFYILLQHILISFFFTCCIQALLILTKVLRDENIIAQTVIFNISLWFFFVFSTLRKSHLQTDRQLN